MAAGDANEFFSSIPSAVTVNSVNCRGCIDMGFTHTAENAVMHVDDKQFAFDGGNIQNAPPVLTLRFAAHRSGSNPLETVFPPGGTLAGSLVATLSGKAGASALTKTYTVAAARVNGISKGEMNRRATNDVELMAFTSDATGSGVVIAIA